MKYDFTTIYDRRGKDACSVEEIGKIPGFAPEEPKEGFDVIPMWVADMSFATVPTAVQEIVERAQHPLYGYYELHAPYFDAIIDWQKKRNGAADLKAENIGYENGVLGGIVAAANVLCSKGDHILVHAPLYSGFISCLEDNGYHPVFSPLELDEDNIYRMNLGDMEEKIVENNIHACVFCSPHNPTGRVWERWELEAMMELFKKHDVYVIADEIWSDLIRPDRRHIPTQLVSEDAKMRTVAFYAPSKTFNLAGLIGSYHIAYDEWLRDRMMKETSLSYYNNQNVLSMHALLGAYRPEGHEWVDELNQVLADNIDFACDYITTHFEGVTFSKPQGTYLLFADCTKWCEAHGKTIDDVEHAAWDVGVAVQDGRRFRGNCHLRINLALPSSMVKEAFDRLDKYVFNA